MKKELITLTRGPQSKTQTLGVMEGDRIRLFTLELPWNDNKYQISCIPTGLYEVLPRFSKKYGHHFILGNVPNRSYILIHAANYVSQLLGCIAVGTNMLDINKDGNPDTTSSRVALDLLINKYPTGFMLHII